MKFYETLAAQHCSCTELIFLAAQPTVSISKKHYRHNSKKYSQSAFYGQVISLKNFAFSSETETVNDQPTEFRKCFTS